MRIGPTEKANVALMMIKNFTSLWYDVLYFVALFFSQYACESNKNHVDFWVVCSDSLLPLWCFFFYDARGPDLQLRSVRMKMLAIENIAIWRGIVN